MIVFLFVLNRDGLLCFCTAIEKARAKKRSDSCQQSVLQSPSPAASAGSVELLLMEFLGEHWACSGAGDTAVFPRDTVGSPRDTVCV